MEDDRDREDGGDGGRATAWRSSVGRLAVQLPR